MMQKTCMTMLMMKKRHGLYFQHINPLKSTKNSIANYFMSAPLGKYGIELKENQQFIGTIDLRVQENEDNAEIGYALNKNYWGRGFVPEASQALIKLGFEELNLVRIFAYHDAENPKSGRVMEKLGMRKKKESSLMQGVSKEKSFQLSCED